MQDLNLCISVGELLGITRVTISGRVNNNHIKSIKDILSGIINQGVNNIVLDVSCLCFEDKNDEKVFIKLLKENCDETSIHILANKKTVKLLNNSNISSTLNFYGSTDDISEYLISEINHMALDSCEIPDNNHKAA